MAIDLSVFNVYWTCQNGIYMACDGPGKVFVQSQPVPSPPNFAVIQNLGTISQSFMVLVAGVYTVSFSAQISTWFSGAQTYKVKLDGITIYTSSGTGGFTWNARTISDAVNTNLTVGAHVISFEGQHAVVANQPEWALIDSVSITGPGTITLLNSNFDTFKLNPDTQVFNPPATAVAIYNATFTATTSGLWFYVLLKNISNSAPVQYSKLNQGPDVYVNGINVGQANISMAQQHADYTGFLMPMPDGVRVLPSDSVVLNAPEGWAFGPSGYASAVVNQPVLNKASVSYVRDFGIPRTMKLGIGWGLQLTPEWHNIALMKNWRFKCAYSTPSASEAFGGRPITLAASPTIYPIVGSIATNNIDGTKFPTIKGYWAVRWDDDDHSPDFTNGTNFALGTGGDVVGTVVEVMSLGNFGSNGVGKVRVFDVQYAGPNTNAQIWLYIYKSSKDPHFSNLAILCPGDFAWTAGQPTVIPMPAWHELSSIATARVPTAYAFGPFRTNDSQVGVKTDDASSQKEHLMNPDDFRWAKDVRDVKNNTYVSARPWSNAVSPYFYSPIHGSPFPCTLGADVNTTPVSGTRENWTINDAVTAPVFRGLVLEDKGERCRVMTVTGTTINVERGSENTTPVTHTAGPINCRNRVSVPGITSWGGQAIQVLELVTTNAHNLETSQMVHFQGNGWPILTCTDGNKINTQTNTLTDYNMSPFVTSANSFVVVITGNNTNSVTLDSTYDLTDATGQSRFSLDYIPIYGGCPNELATVLATKYPGSDAWCSIPTAATDDMIYELARRQLAVMPPGRRLWIEYMNEPWNYSYPATRFSMTMGWILYGTNVPLNYVLGRTCQIKAIFKAVFDTQGRGSEIKSLLNMQTVSYGQSTIQGLVDQCNNEGYVLDGIAIAPYYAPAYNTMNHKIYAGYSTEMYIDFLMLDNWYSSNTESYSYKLPKWRQSLDNVNAATVWNATGLQADIRLHVYEYGTDQFLPVFNGQLGAAMDATTATLTLSKGETHNPSDQSDADLVQIGSMLHIDYNEWVKVINRVGAVCTVVRAQSGTIARTHAVGATVVNDWVEGRDVKLHPNFKIFYSDMLTMFQKYGVELCVATSQCGEWVGGSSMNDYHSLGQLPGRGDGTQGGFDNRLTQARPGPNQKPATVNQESLTDSVSGFSQIEWYGTETPINLPGATPISPPNPDIGPLPVPKPPPVDNIAHHHISYPLVSNNPSFLLSPERRGRALIIQNNHATVDIWLGGPSVTVGNGICLKANTTLCPALEMYNTFSAWYAVAASLNDSVVVDEIY